MNRPDCLEVFAGKAVVSDQFSRWGWHTAEPVDLEYGTDLRVEETRTWLLEWTKAHRPRLVIVAYPCRLWSPLTNMQYNTPQAKRRLARLRKQDMPFLNLCEEIFNIQIGHGDDALAENPLTSASFTTEPIKRTLQHPTVYTAVSHGCQFGMKHPKNGKPLLKPTLWFSTSVEICEQLARKCTNGQGNNTHEHAHCLGAAVTQSAQCYTKEVAQAICRGFMLSLKKKEPSRIRTMLRVISTRLRSKRDRACEGERKELRWSEKSIKKAMQSWNTVFAVEHGSSAADSSMNPPCEEEMTDRNAGGSWREGARKGEGERAGARLSESVSE